MLYGLNAGVESNWYPRIRPHTLEYFTSVGNSVPVHPNEMKLAHNFFPEKVLWFNPCGQVAPGCVMSTYATLVQPPSPPQLVPSMSQ